MINKSLALLITILIVSGCHKTRFSSADLSVNISSMSEFKNTLLVHVENKSKDLFCVSGDQIEASFVNFSITQNGSRIYSRLNVDRPFKDFRSINAMVPVYLIPTSGRTFEYDLSDFPLKSGIFNVDGAIKAATCASLFGPKSPDWQVVPVHARSKYPLG